MTIRHAHPSDYGRVIQHVNAWWGGREMAPMLPKLFFLHFEGTSFVAEDDEGRLVAFLIGFVSQTDPAEAYIHFVGVAPEQRGSGVGRELYERFFAVGERAGLQRRPLCHVSCERRIGRVSRSARVRGRPRRPRLRRAGRGSRAVRQAARLTPIVYCLIGQRSVRVVAYHGLMAKVIVQHVCSECGTTTGRWLGKCPGCGAFGTLIEELTGQPREHARQGRRTASPGRCSGSPTSVSRRRPGFGTGVPELDRVLGGGLVPASLVLVGGEPGVGKSTLLLTALGNVAAAAGGRCSSPARSRSPR